MTTPAVPETQDHADTPLDAEALWHIVTALVLALEDCRPEVEEYRTAEPNLTIRIETQAFALHRVCRHILDAHHFGQSE